MPERSVRSVDLAPRLYFPERITRPSFELMFAPFVFCAADFPIVKS